VVAVKVGPDGQSILQILNSEDGKVIAALPNTENLFYTYPKFYGNDSVIAAVRDTTGQMALGIISLNNGEANYITPFSYNVIGFPFVQHDTIYFSASHLNNDELFAYDNKNKHLYHLENLTGKGIGYYHPTANDVKIAWSTFTAAGFRLEQINKDEISWKEIAPAFLQEEEPKGGIGTPDHINTSLISNVHPEKLSVTNYSKVTRIINFHSLEPTVDDPDYTLTLVSENILNTLQSALSFTYNRTEEYKRIGFNTTYAALYPYLSAGVDYTIDRRGLYHGKRVYWNEIEPRAGLSVPFNFSKGRSLTFFRVGTDYTYNSSQFKGQYKDSIGNISYAYMSNFLSFSHQLQSARQHIFPRFAQTISLGYKRAVTHYEGSQFVANGNLYLPGLMTNHNIVFNAGYLRKDTSGQLNFSSGFPFLSETTPVTSFV